MLNNIQYLRAIAALMVVWEHARGQFKWLEDQFPSHFGSHGVDLFFVLSGFIMIYTTHNTSISPQRFFMKRLIRVAPLYWIASLVVSLVALTAPSILRSTVFNFEHLFLSLLFIPTLSPVFSTQFWPVIIPGWTLNYEMAFYLLFATSLIIREKARVPFLGFVLCFAALAGLLFDPSGLVGFYTNQIIVTFFSGALIGHFYVNKILFLSKSRGLFVVCIGLLLWVYFLANPTTHRFIDAGIPASLVVLGVLY